MRYFDEIAGDIPARSDQATEDNDATEDFGVSCSVLMSDEGEEASDFPVEICVAHGREPQEQMTISAVTLSLQSAERVYAALGEAIRRVKAGELRAPPEEPGPPMTPEREAEIDERVRADVETLREADAARYHERHLTVRKLVKVFERRTDEQILFDSEEAALLYITKNYPRAKREKDSPHYIVFRVKGKMVASMFTAQWVYGARPKPRKASPAKLKLYWCTTDDHDEDWFVIAPSKRDACRFHEDAEGYERGDAEAELVCRLPDDLQNTPVGWPDDELLTACGGRMVTDLPRDEEHGAMRDMLGQGGRIVIFGSRAYREGDLVENVQGRLSSASNEELN